MELVKIGNKMYERLPEDEWNSCKGCAFSEDPDCPEEAGTCHTSIFVLSENCIATCALLEEIRDWLSAPQRTPDGMETHRAESEGVDHLLTGVVEALGGE